MKECSEKTCTQPKMGIQPQQLAPELIQKWDSESCTESQIQPSSCPFPGVNVLGFLRTAGVTSCTMQVSRPVQVNSTDCTFASFHHHLVLLWGAGGHVRLPQGTMVPQSFVIMVSHRSAFSLCMVKDLGFMFISLNRNQTQQSQLRNGCPPRVW